MQTISSSSSPPRSIDLSRKLVAILDKLLATGDWEASSFLKKARDHLCELRDEAQSIVDKFSSIGMVPKSAIYGKDLEADTVRVFISLYQVEGNNLQIWLNTLRALAMYNVTRPTYRSEEHVRDLVNSKADPKRHGYVETLVHESDIIPITPLPVDTLGHELLILKEGAVKFANIIKFVHANKKIYRVFSNKLAYEEDIEV